MTDEKNPIIGVVGGGTVGSATARVWMEWSDVRVYDALPERSTHTLARTLESDLVFVCLPTPQGDTGRFDTSAIDEFFGRSDVRESQAGFVLRSTVPVGTTRRIRESTGLDLVHSPEFLTARCAVADAMIPSRNIIGGEHARARIDLIRLYQRRFPGIGIHVMTSDESELVKLIQNGFFAVKIAYFNEVNYLCCKLGADWQRVLSGVLSDGRIAHAHTRVPGPGQMFGYGGACLPKDLANLIHELEVAGAPAHVARGAQSRNAFDRKRAA